MAVVRLTVVANELEAEILTGRLQASGIESYFRALDKGAGIAALGSSPVEVLVEEKDLADAQSLLPEE